MDLDETVQDSGLKLGPEGMMGCVCYCSCVCVWGGELFFKVNVK